MSLGVGAITTASVAIVRVLVDLDPDAVVVGFGRSALLHLHEALRIRTA